MYLNRYIKVTKENEKEVLEALEELGFVWIDNSKPTNFKPLEVNIILDSLFIRLGKCNILSYFINMSCNKYFIEDTEITLEELKSFLPNKTPKIIKKLKDLDGLKNDNGWELSFESTDNFKDKGYYQEWVRLDDKSNKGWFNSFYELTDKTIDLLKTGGFEFEYKPLRKLEEVIEEMKLKTESIFKEDINYDLYEVEYIKFTKHYKIRLAETVGAPVFVAGLAQKYADELNEILGSN